MNIISDDNIDSREPVTTIFLYFLVLPVEYRTTTDSFSIASGRAIIDSADRYLADSRYLSSVNRSIISSEKFKRKNIRDVESANMVMSSL